MLATLVFGFLWQLIGYRCHPLYRAFLKLQLAFFRWKLQVWPSIQGARAAGHLQLMVLYDKRAAWPEFVPHLEKLSIKQRVEVAQYLFYLFWINARFAEASETCNYWQKNAHAWISENENNARHALYSLRQIATWKPGYRETSKATQFEATELRDKARKYGSFWVTHYRNAKLAGLILEWLKEKDYAPAIDFLRSHKMNRNPPFPPRFYFSHDFGFDLSQELGMEENLFLNLCRKAEVF